LLSWFCFFFCSLPVEVVGAVSFPWRVMAKGRRWL
jgi:hypothetical protein